MHMDITNYGIDPILLPGEQQFSLEMDDGRRVRGYFRDTGSGPLGIYLHGFRSHCNGEKSLQIAEHAARLDRSWLRFDLRGHGLSDGELKEQTITHALEDLLRVIDRFGESSCVLHGSSMGAWISLLAALRRKSVLGMMLIAPAFNYVQNTFASLPATVLREWQKSTYMSFPDAYGDEPYSLNYGILEDAMQYDVMHTDYQLDLPIHIVHGENDPVVPISNTKQFIQCTHLPQLVFEKIPGAEHRLTEHLPILISHIDQLWQEIYL